MPTREAAMTPYELMLSESQERMLIILRPEGEAEARAIFERWDLDFAVIGQLTETGRLVLSMNGDNVADIPIDPMVEASPEYDRPWEPTAVQPPINPAGIAQSAALAALLLQLMGTPDLASRRGIWQ